MASTVEAYLWFRSDQLVRLYVCKTYSDAEVVVSNWRVLVYLLKLRFDYESLSARLFAENFRGLIICLRADTQSRNCSFQKLPDP